MNETKACTRCREEKPLNEFGVDKWRPDNKSIYCRVCKRLSHRGSIRTRTFQADVVVTGVKRCSRCHEVKSLSDFHSSKNRVGGVGNNCKSCQRTYLRERRAADPDSTTDLDNKNKARRWEERGDVEYARAKLRWRLTKYHLTVEQYEEMLRRQNYKCVICARLFSEMTTTPHVDHDHSCCPRGQSCGECVRSLLCNGCNTGLGALQENEETLRRAIVYLRSFSTSDR